MSISRSTSLFLAVSMTAAALLAGCAAKPGAAVITDEMPELATKQPITPSLAPDDEQRQHAVVDTVGDNVDRVSAILRQREQAKQAASDVREIKAAQQSADASKQVAKAPLEDASTIEKLAAALRDHKEIDPAPETKPVVAAKPSSNTPLAATDTLVTPAEKELTRLPEEPAAGAMDAGTGKQIVSPNISRSSSGDPMLAVQQKFTNRVAQDPRDLDAQLNLQLLHFLKDEPVPTVSDLAALPSEDRELLSALCDALSNFRSVVRDEPNPLNSIKARPFIEMADRMRTRADLTLSYLALCSKVEKFGVYDKIEPLAFPSGQPNRVVVYCEVDGFTSALNGNQLWQTKLSLEVRLYDDHGLQVWQAPPQEAVDSSNRRRRDFFLGKIIELPDNLPSGHYMLKASVRDLQASRIDEKTIQFKLNPKDEPR